MADAAQNEKFNNWLKIEWIEHVGNRKIINKSFIGSWIIDCVVLKENSIIISI